MRSQVIGSTSSVETIETTDVSVMNASAALQYREMDDVPVQEVALIEVVEQNLRTLSELQTRYSFLMKEVRYLLKI